ncbi:MAG: hypothetical protein ACOC33_03845 [bacterium]
MKAKKVTKTTTNRGEFNRAYKKHLEHKKNGISCSYCKYHRGENKTTKHYGGWNDDITYPSWKLVSKNSKQWMKKPIKIKEVFTNNYGETWSKITW